MAYIFLGLAGWGYFGSGEWAQKFRGTALYKDLMKRPIEKVLGTSGGEGELSGRILEIKKAGEIRYKPSESFSFFPADPDQIFYGKNVVSTGPGAEIVLAIGSQNYELTLYENTSVVIDGTLYLGESDETPMQIEVLGGQVDAKLSEAGRAQKGNLKKLQIINLESGVSQELDPNLQEEIQVQNTPKTPVAAAPSRSSIAPVIDSSPQKTEMDQSAPKRVLVDSAEPVETHIPFEESLEGFNDTVESSMNSILEAEISKPSCGQAKTFLDEVRRSYSASERMSAWAKKWNERIMKAKCS